jgi:hypothetical protein
VGVAAAGGEPPGRNAQRIPAAPAPAGIDSVRQPALDGLQPGAGQTRAHHLSVHRVRHVDELAAAGHPPLHDRVLLESLDRGDLFGSQQPYLERRTDSHYLHRRQRPGVNRLQPRADQLRQSHAGGHPAPPAPDPSVLGQHPAIDAVQHQLAQEKRGV